MKDLLKTFIADLVQAWLAHKEALQHQMPKIDQETPVAPAPPATPTTASNQEPASVTSQPQPVQPKGRVNYNNYPRLITFCRDINLYESGSGPSAATSAASRHNNPGNIRCPEGRRDIWNHLASSGGIANGNFCVFPDKATGWEALYEKWYNIATGKSETYSARGHELFGVARSCDLTILQVMTIYAPPGDGNDPAKYAQWLTQRNNLAPTWTTKDLLT